MKNYAIREKLKNAGVNFTEEITSSNGFWGYRFTFGRKDIKKVEKALGDWPIVRYFKEWCVEVY